MMASVPSTGITTEQLAAFADANIIHKNHLSRKHKKHHVLFCID